MALDHVFAEPPLGAASDWTVPQGWSHYTEADHRVWLTLYDRQTKVLPGRACDSFLKGLEALDLRGEGVPDFIRINQTLRELTGWSVVAVPGLVPDEVFFDHLAHRRFPAGRFIRMESQLDYLQEPDIFHDVFGHVPMLTDPIFADYMQAYGEGGRRALGLGQLTNLARLYWYTVEFGLLQSPSGLRIYGAGILSSKTESIFSLSDSSPNRIAFDLERVMRTPYRIDDFQQCYFVISTLEHLLNATLGDFSGVYERLRRARDIGVEEILHADKVFTRGSQNHATVGLKPSKDLASKIRAEAD